MIGPMVALPAQRRVLEVVAVAGLLLALLLQAVFSIERISLTTDEHTHIPAGYSYWRARDFRLNPEHPPLAKLVAGLPLQFRDLSTESSWPVFEAADFDSLTWDQWVFGRNFLFVDNQAVHDGSVSAARRAVLIFPLLLAICVWAWARLSYGPAGGLIALTLAVFSPDVLAHGRLVNTDAAMAAFYVACPFAFWLHLRSPSLPRLLAVGVALGLGLAAKYSSVLLLPLLGVMALAALSSPPRAGAGAAGFLDPAGHGSWLRRLLWMAANGVLVFVVAILVLWATYLFAAPPTLWLQGYGEIYKNLSPHFRGFLLGEFHEGRIWPYFLVTFLLKTPLPVMALSLLGLLAAWRHRRRLDAVALTTLVVAPLALFLASTLRAQPIGHRYILGIYPYLFVIAGAAVWLVPASGRWRAAALAALGLLVGGSALAGIRAHPFYLPYHNALVPSDLTFLRYLNYSNNDWGQGWREVVRLQERGELGPLMVAQPGRLSKKLDYGGAWVVTRRDTSVPPAPGTHAETDWYRKFWDWKTTPEIYRHEPVRVVAGSIVIVEVPEPGPERPVESLETYEGRRADGRVAQRFHYYEDDGGWVRSGPYEIYFENGRIRERGSYRDGELSGPYAKFYETGPIREEGAMWNGRLHGTLRKWHETGTLASEEHYLLGQRVPALRSEREP